MVSDPSFSRLPSADTQYRYLVRTQKSFTQTKLVDEMVVDEAEGDKAGCCSHLSMIRGLSGCWMIEI